MSFALLFDPPSAERSFHWGFRKDHRALLATWWLHGPVILLAESRRVWPLLKVEVIFFPKVGATVDVLVWTHQTDEKIGASWSMSAGFRRWTFPSILAPNINEASSKDINPSLHRNALSWGVWRGQEEKESVSLRAITHSAYSQTADSGSNLFRTASVPDVVGRSQKTAFSSITIAARKVLPLLSTSQDPGYSPTLIQPVKVSSPPKLPENFEGSASSIMTTTMRVSNSQPGVCRQNPNVTPNVFRQDFSPADGLAVRERGKRKVQQCRWSFTEGDRKQDIIGGSLMNLSSQPYYQSCFHLEVPLRTTSSVVFLDKSLSISLMKLEGRGAGQPTLYRSTLSVRLGVSSCRRSSTDNKPAKANESYGRSRAATLGHNKCNGRESGLGHCRGPLSKHWGHKVEEIAPAHGVNSKADDSDMQHGSATLGILSFRGPSPSNTKAGRQKGNADEADFPTQSNFRHRQHSSKIGPGMNFITLLQKRKSQVPMPIDLYCPFTLPLTF
ncbi:uncharacterized protein LOC123984340 isoform X1 [Micropterus dolomieu]|uniref:uncharacterized protein LOC123984340 isoform X1 n=2 Tax=Micropterus dolomieu TaxID=147949 RepID=UPI001E8EABC1|nr:uncharacterized protein LOC123984340 isoform X1 [Micropterus dolomieu]XP_045927136.1 uncharacterized protein LOC123984340 isoform X1 [Micropterus dolomieu]XP_045927137.1 uncharacterized protein LOC123984340 isoform X1 [Micropterus dolomieu]XP_045927138.1 uncharacterized protein LOC123984340 isoform X1 [Micropterus dolomieu]